MKILLDFKSTNKTKKTIREEITVRKNVRGLKIRGGNEDEEKLKLKEKKLG